MPSLLVFLQARIYIPLVGFQRRLVIAHATFGDSFLEFYGNGDIRRIKYPFILLIRFIRPIIIKVTENV